MSTTDCKSAPRTSQGFESKILHFENILCTLFPLGVNSLILDYFLDSIIITSEYHQAIFTGNLALIQRIDKQWKNLLIVENDREGKCSFLMGDAMEYNQTHIAEYFRDKMLSECKADPKKKVGQIHYISSSFGYTAMDEKKLQFMLQTWSEEELQEIIYDTIYTNANTTFLRVLFKLFPNFHFIAEKDESEGGDEDIDRDESDFLYVHNSPATITYCMLTHGKKNILARVFNEEMKENNIYPLNPSTCLVADICAIDVRICKCNRNFLRDEEEKCSKCIEEALPKLYCNYIFARGERRGEMCGKPTMPGSKLCKMCANKKVL